MRADEQPQQKSLYPLLTVLCGAAMAYELWVQFKAVGHSNGFIEFLRHLLS